MATLTRIMPDHPYVELQHELRVVAYEVKVCTNYGSAVGDLGQCAEYELLLVHPGEHVEEDGERRVVHVTPLYALRSVLP